MPSPQSLTPASTTATNTASSAVSEAPTAVDASATVNAVVNNSSAAAINNGISNPNFRQNDADTSYFTDDNEEIDETVSDEAKKAAAEKKRQDKKKERQAQQIRQLEEMKQTPLENIRLTDDEKDVLKIGSVVWKDVELQYRVQYLKDKNIRFGRSRSKEQLGGVIVEYLKALPYKSAVSTTRRIPDAAATTRVSTTVQRGNGTVARKSAKPNFLTEGRDGTFFRIANVMRHHKECYVATKSALNRSELDSGIAHIVEWNTMLSTYNKDIDHSNPDLEIDCVQCSPEMEVFGIDPMYATVIDGPLNLEQFMQVVGYMEGQYNDCCKRCKRSGEMDNFLEKINGLVWLGYMRTCFLTVGDTSLHDTVFSELPTSVLSESTGGAPGARQRGSGSRSTSPVPPGGSGKKLKASAAIQDAAKALDDRMTDLNRTENVNACMALTAKRDETELAMIELDDRLGTMKAMRKAIKRRGESFADEAEYKRLKKKTKQTHATYNMLVKEVKCLEKLLGYDDRSTGEKSSSSSDDDIDDINNSFDSA
ncbi:hypothetical protein ACHAW6_016209 [Cyclotella cf. meneghiniana]